MHGATMKIVDAKQAKAYYAYKNTRLKLIKTNAALWFNKMYRIKQLKPNYIQFKSNRSTFQYFVVLIVSTYYILCISRITKCLIIIDARCKHED